MGQQIKIDARMKKSKDGHRVLCGQFRLFAPQMAAALSEAGATVDVSDAARQTAPAPGARLERCKRSEFHTASERVTA
jgi:hypothetical protein